MSRRIPAAALAAVVLSAAVAAGAVAASFTLKVAKHAKVVSATSGATTRPNVVVTAKGMVVYTLSGDTRSHPKCTKGNGCLQFWPPVTVASARKLTRAAGVKGKLGTFKRNGFTQVTLDGHPLYTFSVDTHRDVADGEGIQSFGGTWHVRLAG